MMACKSDLSKLVTEIEWLVKDHSGGKFGRENERLKTSEEEFYTMKITLDIFVKLHQMLQNYIGLLDFRGAKSRDFDEIKIPLKEALDVAVRAMISAMQTPVPNQLASTLVRPNRVQKFGRVERSSGNAEAKCQLAELSEAKEIDEKLQRLKNMTLGNVEELKTEIKDVLHGITKLPCTLMESKLEILSSVVKNTKNKLMSCGRPASLMGTQVNSICQIISEFILEYGQIKSQIYPCRKICRFCGNVVCPMDRQRGIFCCENARNLNYLWNEWIRKNSVNGIAKWDEDTIMSIVDSFRSEINQEKRKSSCLANGPCLADADYYTTTRRQRCSELNTRCEKGSDAKPEPVAANLRRDRGQRSSSLGARTKFKSVMGKKKSDSHVRREEISSSDSSRGTNRGDDAMSGGRRARGSSRDGKNRVKDVVRSNTEEKRRPVKDPEKVKLSEAKLVIRGNRERGIHAADKLSGKNISGEVDGTKEAFDADITGRKKTSNKGVDEAANLGVAVEGDNNRRKGATINRRSEKDSGGTTREDVEGKRRGKSYRKKDAWRSEGEILHPDTKGDQRIGNTVTSGTEHGIESKKNKKRENPGITNGGGDEHRTLQDNMTSILNQKGNTSGGKGASGSERRPQSGSTEVEKNSGAQKRVNKNLENFSGKTRTREEKYREADWERSSGGVQEEKSGDGLCEDSENIIRYRLSNELFIELGWTLLPKDTVMRRVVEFQALQAKPHMNWFKNNRIYGKQYYNDGKTVFLDFLGDGSGQVYYPNGQMAIETKISQKQTHELYKVYAQGGRDAMGVMRLPWLMGVFDSMGNGVVYDENCDVRITYNQNGGVFADNPTGVPFSWGWNNFQISPIDQPVHKDHRIEQLRSNQPPVTENGSLHLKSVKNSTSQASNKSTSSKMTSSKKISEDQPIDSPEMKKSMITPETAKIVETKCIAPVKPICLRMNKYLSLRILDRRNINLKFFSAPKSIRIELGTDVNPNVQINSELVDRDDWAAKMTRSRFDVNVMQTSTINSPNQEDSVLEIAEEIQRAKNEANSRQLMIAKYKPHLISPSYCAN